MSNCTSTPTPTTTWARRDSGTTSCSRKVNARGPASIATRAKDYARNTFRFRSGCRKWRSCSGEVLCRLQAKSRSVHEDAGVGADVVGPQDDGQDASPETQVQVADGKQPCCEPSHSHKRLLMDLNLLRVCCAGIGRHEFLRHWVF